MSRRLFISDLHLEFESAPAFKRLEELLTVESSCVDEIYILGDLVEMWIGDDDDGPVASSLKALFKKHSQTVRIYLMHGNRDFLITESFTNSAHIQLLSDPYITHDGIYLSHGDAYCVDDVEYQQMRTLFRSETWQADTLSKTLDERKALGHMLRSQSKANNANKPGNIMDVNTTALQQALLTTDCHVVIHGHTHRPGIHSDEDTKRYVLGAWERCGWLCRQTNDELRLECFSLSKPYPGAGTPL